MAERHIPVYPETIIPRPFAEDGNYTVIPDSQAKSGNGLASWATGFPYETQEPLSRGGVAPSRTDFNGIFNALSQVAVWLQMGGQIVWNAAQDYNTPALVLHNNKWWYCAKASGPATVAGAVTPGRDNSYWQEYGNLLFGDTVRAINNRIDGVQASVDVSNVKSDLTVAKTEISGLKTDIQSILDMLARYSYRTLTLYVDGNNGNDNNDGLAANRAFKTIQKAVYYNQTFCQKKIIRLTAGTTFTERVTIESHSGKLEIQGDSNNKPTLSGASRIEVIDSNVLLNNIKISPTINTARPDDPASIAVMARRNSYVEVSNCDVAITATNANTAISFGSVEHAIMKLTGNITSSVNSNTLYSALYTVMNAVLWLDPACRMTINGNYAVVGTVQNSSLLVITQTAGLTGNATGIRFRLETNGVINTESQGYNRIPGSATGEHAQQGVNYF